MGVIDMDTCMYKTPCGWCSRFEKQCDNKLPQDVVVKKTKNRCIHSWIVHRKFRLGTEYMCTNCGLTYIKFSSRSDSNADSDHEG
jgi:hypothetical protein